MPFKHLRLLLPLLLTLAATALASTTWYVNGVTGSDTNNCLSATAACKTIGHAISLAASGDSIKIAAGTYFEHLTINISVKLLGASASTSIIDGGGGTGTVVTTSSGTNVTLSGVTITHGSAVLGGGIANHGTLLLVRSTVSRNRAGTYCGKHKLCFSAGGGIYNIGLLTITNSTIADNKASAGCAEPCNASASGGGIGGGGTLTISNSTISGNTALAPNGGRGGGISGRGTISNSTISGNGASLCGGISDGPISNSTISGNRASLGGGICGGTLQNSIVANNSGGNCLGTPTSNAYNLSSDSTCNFSGPGDMNNIDPLLGPLQNNGGPTQTMALLPGSPAIDAGNPAGCTDSHGHLLKTDQRGQPRPDKEDTGGCDIGAYESQSD